MNALKLLLKVADTLTPEQEKEVYDYLSRYKPTTPLPETFDMSQKEKEELFKELAQKKDMDSLYRAHNLLGKMDIDDHIDPYIDTLHKNVNHALNDAKAKSSLFKQHWGKIGAGIGALGALGYGVYKHNQNKNNNK